MLFEDHALELDPAEGLAGILVAYCSLDHPGREPREFEPTWVVHRPFGFHRSHGMGSGYGDRGPVAIHQVELNGGDRRRGDEDLGNPVAADPRHVESAVAVAAVIVIRVVVGNAKALPRPVGAAILGLCYPIREFALRGKPQALDIDAGPGHRPPLQIHDPALDRRTLLRQPDRAARRSRWACARLSSSSRARTRARRRQRRGQPARLRRESSVRIARIPFMEKRPSCPLVASRIGSMSWLMPTKTGQTTAPATGFPSGSTIRPRTSIIAPGTGSGRVMSLAAARALAAAGRLSATAVVLAADVLGPSGAPLPS